MASLDEFNPNRWEAEDEDFLDREDNYVLQKSTNTLVANVTAKTRTRPAQAHRERMSNGSHKNKGMNSSKREPPSFASAKSLRKTHSKRSGSKRSSSSSRLHHSTPSPKQHQQSESQSSSKQPTASLTPKSPASAPQRVPSARKTPAKPAPPARQPQQSLPPNNKKQDTVNTAEKEPDSDEESLDIVDVFPVLEEKEKEPPKNMNQRGWQSQQIFIPTKQEKWNEASVMRMHQSMFSVHREESPYMKDIEFDDDDKSLSIEDVFPVLAEGKGATKPKSTAPPPSASGPAIIQAAKRANANRRWRTAGQKIAATTTKAKPLAAPKPETTTAARHNASAPAASFKPTPLVPLSARASSSAKPGAPAPVPAAATKAPPEPSPPKPPLPPAATKPPPAKRSPSSKVSALVHQFEHKAHESQETTASSTDGKKPGYQLPTYVAKPTASQKEDLQASDDLTMDSALLRSTGSNQNLKESQEEVVEQEERREERELMTAIGAAERQEGDEKMRDEDAAKLERKRSKRSKKSSKKKKKKKSSKSSRRRLEHYASESSFTEQGRDRDTSLGPESIMEREEAEAARKRLKKERKERKKERKRKAKRAAQSERHIPTPKADREDVRLAKSMPDIEESQSSSPDDHAVSSSRKMSESQPVISSKPALGSYLKERDGTGKPRGSTRRSLQSAQSSRKSSDSKRTSKSDGHLLHAQSARQRRMDDDDDVDDARLDSHIRDGKMKGTETSSRMSLRSDSHTTVQRSNVAQKKAPLTKKKSPATSPYTESPKMDPDDFMRSAAAGMLYESEESLSSGAAAAVRDRVRTAREESYRVASPPSDMDYGPSYRKNSAIKPVEPTKNSLDKNVSSTWQQSTPSSSLSPSSRGPLKTASSIRPQKKPSSYRSPTHSPGHRGDSPIRRPDLVDDDRMNSIGNFDMVSAVDAAVAAKKAEKQSTASKLPAVGEKEEEKKQKKKKQGLLKRMFSKRGSPKKKKPERKSRSMPSVMESATVNASKADRDQAALNEYLSSSQSSWYSNQAAEKQELASSAPSSPAVELPSDGGLKFALGTPPGEKSRDLKSSRRRGERRV